MSTLERKQTIRSFLEQSAGVAPSDDEDFFQTGGVSSMFVMQLVLFLEQEFRITLSGDDLRFEFFRTVEALSGLVGRKLEA